MTDAITPEQPHAFVFGTSDARCEDCTELWNSPIHIEAQARPAVASEGLRSAVAARRSRSAAPDVTCGCGDGGNEDGPFTLCAIHEQRWGPLTRDTLLNIVVDWEAAFAEVEGQLDAALASDAGSVGALDVERLARAIRVWWSPIAKELARKHFPVISLDDPDEAAFIIAGAYAAERQGEQE